MRKKSPSWATLDSPKSAILMLLSESSSRFCVCGVGGKSDGRCGENVQVNGALGISALPLVLSLCGQSCSGGSILYRTRSVDEQRQWLVELNANFHPTRKHSLITATL